MKQLILPILVCVIISCQQKTSKETVKLVKKDTLTLHIGPKMSPKTNCMQYVRNNDKKLLAYMHRGAITFYDLETKNQYHQIQYESKGPNGIEGLRGFHFQSFDSIYTFSGIPWTVYHTDSAGLLKNKIELQELQDNNKEYPPSIVQDILHIKNGIISSNNKLYFSTYLLDLNHVDNITEVSVGIVLDQKTGDLKKMPHRYPRLQPQKTNAYSRDYGNGKWVYSFPFVNDIYQLYENGSFKTYPCQSKYAGEKLINSPQETKLEKSLKNIIRDSRYYSIIYDPWQNVFYRIFYPGIEISKDENPQNLKGMVKNKKRFSVMILNENLEVIGETLMPDDSYDPQMYFINEDGLHFAYHINHPEYDPDYLKFARFNVEESNHENK
ncbi:MAG: DUF4221 family protein [Bacteroidota bacterium]